MAVEKEFVDKKTQSTCRLTEEGRHAFERYRRQIQAAMDALPPAEGPSINSEWVAIFRVNPVDESVLL